MKKRALAIRIVGTVFWLIICGAVWLADSKPASDEHYLEFLFLRTVPICAAIGAPFGRAIIGSLVGLGLVLIYLGVLTASIVITGTGP